MENKNEYQSTVLDIVRKAETDYIAGDTQISKYVSYNLGDTVAKIEAYLNSCFTTGKYDSQDREKPFFNTVTAARNIWYRATDIDRKNIKIKANRSKNTILAFVGTVLLHDWMKKVNFGTFLNDWGRVLAGYGSAISKFVEKDGELNCIVQQWAKMIIDAIDFDANVKIEVLELTESQLRRRKGYDKDIVDALCKAKRTRRTIQGLNKDNKPDYIRVYEVTGELPLAEITLDERDADEYVEQLQVVSYIESEKSSKKFEDFVLFRGRTEKNPNHIAHLIKEDGRSLSIGSVENLFQAQWMINKNIKRIDDQLELASKLIFQSADPRFIGLNVLSDIENGDILTHKENMPLTTIANSSHDITSLQNFSSQWKSLGAEINGISESMLGQAAPSGTAWRQVEALLQESHSLFELMTENKGLAIVEMMTKYVLPFFKKKLDHSDEIVAMLEDHDIQKIDAIYIKAEAVKRANKKIIKKVLDEGFVSPLDQANAIQDEQTNLQSSLKEMGNQRFFKPSDIDSTTWKEIFKDFVWDVDVDVTGEDVDKEALTTLNTLLQFIIKKNGQPMTPEERFIFNKILMMTSAVSPLEMSSLPQPAPIPSPIQPPPPVAAPSGA